METTPPREMTLATFLHPDHLRLPTGRNKHTLLTRVDHPDAATLADGDPTLGWEGDAMLCLYADPEADRWLLVRRELGTYQPVRASEKGQRLNREWVNEVIRSLIATDHRRGFDAFDAIVAAEQKREAEADREHEDYVSGELAPKLRWALRRGDADGGGTRDFWALSDITGKE